MPEVQPTRVWAYLKLFENCLPVIVQFNLFNFSFFRCKSLEINFNVKISDISFTNHSCTFDTLIAYEENKI